MYARISGHVFPDESPSGSKKLKPLINPYSLQQNVSQEKTPPSQTKYLYSPITVKIRSKTKCEKKPIVIKIEPEDETNFETYDGPRTPPLEEFQQIPPPQNFQQLPRFPPLQDFQQLPRIPPPQDFQQLPRIPPLQDFQQLPRIPPLQDIQQLPRIPPLQEFQQLPRIPSLLDFQHLPQTPPPLQEFQQIPQTQNFQQIQPLQQTQYTSATTKALNKFKSKKTQKKPQKKAIKVPTCLKRKVINKELHRILTPKSGVAFLNEIQPGCSYKFEIQHGTVPLCFWAQVECGNVVLGTGQGFSKSQAKDNASEDAIKRIFLSTMQQLYSNGNTGQNKESIPENLPWAGLASFALHKMFSEWKNQESGHLSSGSNIGSKKKSKKRELPQNALQWQPTAVMNFMHPSVIPSELEQGNGSRNLCTVGYSINGQMFVGTGGNKKEAKKEAAKAALFCLYGLSYNS